MAHGDACNRNFTPRLRRANEAADFAGKLDSGALAKTEAADVLVEFLFSEVTGEFGCANVARFDENILDTQVAERPMVMQRASSKIPDTVFAKDCRVRVDLVL